LAHPLKFEFMNEFTSLFSNIINCIEKTSEIIRSLDWITVNQIMRYSPKQLVDLSKNIEEQLRVNL